MNRFQLIAVSLLSLWFAFLSGCAHSSHTRGSVALKHSATEADVCLGEKEVKIGDRLVLYRNECTSRDLVTGPKGNMGSRCTKVKVGDGEITNVLNEHYSTMKVSPGTQFDESTIVEKNPS